MTLTAVTASAHSFLTASPHSLLMASRHNLLTASPHSLLTKEEEPSSPRVTRSSRWGVWCRECWPGSGTARRRIHYHHQPLPSLDHGSVEEEGGPVCCMDPRIAPGSVPASRTSYPSGQDHLLLLHFLRPLLLLLLCLLLQACQRGGCPHTGALQCHPWMHCRQKARKTATWLTRLSSQSHTVTKIG